LTVIDPMIGVTIGIVVLGEATQAPLWASFAFLAAAALGVFGVLQLSRRPEAKSGHLVAQGGL
jgi:threonine/homoserine efflux transporter RhtA